MLVALALALISPTFAASYGEDLGVETLIDRAERAVVGVVASTHAARGPDGLIYTIVTLDVDEAVVGKAPSQVEFRVPGGELDGVRLTVPGAPEFVVGQNVMVFLEGQRLTGFGKGAFSVEEGVARRLVVDGPPGDVNLRARFGDLRQASSLVETRVWDFYEEGWTLRTTSRARVTEGESRGYGTTLVGGNEYRFLVNDGGQAAGLWVALYDDEGERVAMGWPDDNGLVLDFVPTYTGTWTLVVYAAELAPNTWRAGVSFAVLYR